MISMRCLGRSVPRQILRLNPKLPQRTLSTIRRSSLLQQSWKGAPIARHAAFSTSQLAREKEGQVDQELSAKVESELRIENETRDSESLPANIQEFLDNSAFELEDIPGQEEVALTRTFGDESIRITFSIADLNNVDQEEADQFDSDPALSDEEAADAAETNVQSGGANTKGSINQGRTKGGNFAVAPEDSIAPSDRAEGSYEDPTGGEGGPQEPSFPARLTINIQKASKGVLQLEAVAQDGEVMIDNIYYFQKPELADAKTAELDWSRRNLYTGPPFGNLDEDLQVLLERYLDERGVNTSLALWIPEYVDWKEQKEYLNWLSNVKSFIDA
ncbi:MAG: hypothetical protein L6R35_005678 [Caloplaca aegaea]|nr:MAG: hypothetical protein L6R35_005678 [Caloplaca aegaea]